MNNRPIYHKLYADMIRDKYPEKMFICEMYLQKTDWTALDVINVNQLLFGEKKNSETIAVDQKHRAYDRKSIEQILQYQKINMLNNRQLANKFGLSRNTVAKWKRLFQFS